MSWRTLWLLPRLLSEGRLVWRLFWNPRVPLASKFIVPGAVLYMLSPLDLIRDVIPLVGRIDDAVVLLLALRLFQLLVPRDVLADNRSAMADPGRGADDGSPSSAEQGNIVEGSYRMVEEDEDRSR